MPNIKIDTSKWTTLPQKAKETGEKLNTLHVRTNRAMAKTPDQSKGEDYWYISELDLLLVPKIVTK